MQAVTKTVPAGTQSFTQIALSSHYWKIQVVLDNMYKLIWVVWFSKLIIKKGDLYKTNEGKWIYIHIFWDLQFVLKLWEHIEF